MTLHLDGVHIFHILKYGLLLATVYCSHLESTKGRALGVFLVTLLPNDMDVCFNHADSFEIDHFDQHFHLIFWLKVNNDTVFEVSILEYDRYEPLQVQGHVSGTLNSDRT